MALDKARRDNICQARRLSRWQQYQYPGKRIYVTYTVRPETKLEARKDRDLARWGRLRPGPNRTKKGGEHRNLLRLSGAPDPTGEIFELIAVAGCLGERALCQVGMYIQFCRSAACLSACRGVIMIDRTISAKVHLYTRFLSSDFSSGENKGERERERGRERERLCV